jgi:hypothetical protein
VGHLDEAVHEPGSLLKGRHAPRLDDERVDVGWIIPPGRQTSEKRRPVGLDKLRKGGIGHTPNLQKGDRGSVQIRETDPDQKENQMVAQLKQQIEKTRKTNPSLAEFVEISHEQEIEAGVRESLATSKWIKMLTGATA